MAESASFLGTTNHTEATDNAAKARVQKNNGYLVGVEDELEVIQATPAAMSVIVGKGEAWVQGVQYINSAAKTVTVDAADATNPRIDRFVVRLTWAADTLEAVYLKGTAAASPSAPALTQTAAVWELSLAQILVTAGKTSILTADITDERNTAYCGQAACNLGSMHTEADGTLNAASHKITNLTDPTSAQDADTKTARDTAIAAAVATSANGWREKVVAASTTAVTLANVYNGTTLDGVTLVTGDRVLLKDQADGTSGIYIVAASGAPSRATDFNTAALALGASVAVVGGTSNAGTAWRVTNTAITFGTTVLTFSQYTLIPPTTAGGSLLMFYEIPDGRAFTGSHELTSLGYPYATHTIRHAGTYRFFFRGLTSSSGSAASMTVYKNGSTSGSSASTTSTSAATVYVDVACAAGDVITFIIGCAATATVYGVAIGIAADCYY